MILFYVSGHGYGHATRTNAVIESLFSLRPDIRIHVRSMAPQFLFDGRIQYSQTCIEPAVVEREGSLGVDLSATADAVRQYLEGVDEIIAREAQFAAQERTGLIVADIPFTAGPIAVLAGARSVAIGNFLWSWIFKGSGVEQDIRARYAQFDRALRYPLSHDDGWDVFPEVEDLALVAPRSRRSRAEIRAELGVSDGQPVVLVGGRARLSAEANERILRECGEFAFVYNDSLPDYLDLAHAADIVVSKTGYSTAAQAIAEGQVLVYPPRTGFPEDAMLIPQLERFGRALEIPLEAWASGNWRPWLRRALTLLPPKETLATNGADECAAILLRMLG